MIPKLDWSAFHKATQMLGDVEVSVPEKLIESFEKDPEFLKKVHHALLEVISHFCFYLRGRDRRAIILGGVGRKQAFKT